MSWDYVTHGGALKDMYDKDERWLLTASAKSLADHGPLRRRAVGSSASLLASSASLPTLKIKAEEKNPILGMLNSEAGETHDWTSHNNRIHTAMPLMTSSSAAGMGTRFGVREHSGKISYAPESEAMSLSLSGKQIAEALGRSRAEMIGSHRPPARQASPALRRTPSTAELEELLKRRSRARGLGGKHVSVVDVVQTKWSVMYSSGSAASVSMICKQ